MSFAALSTVALFGGAKRSDQTAGHKEGLLGGAMTIAWDDQYKQKNIMWKVPRNIRMNDNIVVREDEIAVFYRDGKALAYLDVPNRYALTSQNAAVVGWFQRVFTGVQQQAEVYYLQKRIFDGKFGSKDPFIFEDPDFDLIELKTFGEFRYKILSAENFINQFVGTFALAASADIENRIREELVKQLYVTIGNMKQQGMKVTQLATSLNQIEQFTLENSKPHFGNLGIEIVQLSGLNIPIPEEIKEAIRKASGARVLGRAGPGGVAAYQQFAVADSMKTAAAQPGGAAGLGMGLGAGVGMGYAMGSQVPGMMQPGQQAQQTKPCVKCGKQIPVSLKFCGECGAEQVEGKPCVKCGKVVAPGLKFCGECGSAQTIACPSCKTENPGNLKFCGNCGKPLGG